jgi:hypothetical protein
LLGREKQYLSAHVPEILKINLDNIKRCGSAMNAEDVDAW